MCDTCDGKGYINGRVDHAIGSYAVVRCYRPSSEAATGTVWGETQCWAQGNYLSCPLCHPEQYGRIVKVTKN